MLINQEIPDLNFFVEYVMRGTHSKGHIVSVSRRQTMEDPLEVLRLNAALVSSLALDVGSHKLSFMIYTQPPLIVSDLHLLAYQAVGNRITVGLVTHHAVT